MKAAGLILLGVAVGACMLLAQTKGQKTFTLPAYNANNLKQPKMFVSLWPLAHIDDWEPFEQPASYASLAKDLKTAIDKGDWPKATDLGLKLYAMLPEGTPDSYPWSYDTRALCETAIADLLTVQGKWEQATALYEKVLKETPKNRQGAARQAASYGLANMYAVSGRFEEAQALFKKAGDEYWSGCGNCAESEAVAAHVKSLIIKAAALPHPKAGQALLKIVNGEFVPYKARLMGADNGKAYQQRIAAIEGSFHLGVLYERGGDKLNARKAYGYCVAKTNGESWGFEPACAWMKLKALK